MPKNTRFLDGSLFLHVLDAKYIKDHRVWIKFNDGKSGEIDLFQRLRNSPEDSVFKPLEDINYFRKFKINLDTLTWENEADFAPEFLHELLITQNKNKKN